MALICYDISNVLFCYFCCHQNQIIWKTNTNLTNCTSKIKTEHRFSETTKKLENTKES